MNIDESPNEITGSYKNYFLVIIRYGNIIEAIKRMHLKPSQTTFFVSITKKVLLLLL